MEFSNRVGVGELYLMNLKILHTCTIYVHGLFIGSKKVRFSLHVNQVAHKAGVYPGFCSMKRLGIILFYSTWVGC